MHVLGSIADMNETHVMEFLFGKDDLDLTPSPNVWWQGSKHSHQINKQKKTQTKNEKENLANCRVNIK